MERKIEFRIKDNEGKWHYGYPVFYDDGSFHFFDCDLLNKENPMYPIELCYIVGTLDDTLGQYVGLEDKNGNKIYEGDIVKLTRTNMYAPSASFHNQDLVSLHRIYWNDEKHCFYQEHFDIEKKRVVGGGSLNFNDERAKENIIEVIGNIYDNKDLLN